MLRPGDIPVFLGRRDTHGRFSAASDSARDLQHHRLPDARRLVHRSAGEGDIDVGCGMGGDAERRAAYARHPAAARRSHQGRAPRREISHRPSAVADRVRRGGGRIRAVAEVRHLDLFPADGTVAGGFPLRPCIANAAPCRCGSGGACACAKSRQKPPQKSRLRPSPSRPRSRQPHLPPAPAAPSVPPAASVAESVLQDHPEPKPVQPAVTPEAAAPKTPSPEVPSPEVQSPEVPSPGLQPGPGFPPPPDKPDTPQR